jgi:hypothetical protein
MQRRVNGLREECRLLAAEIAKYETGGHREIDTLPNKVRVDITDMFVVHLKDILDTKQRFVIALDARIAQGS